MRLCHRLFLAAAFSALGPGGHAGAQELVADYGAPGNTAGDFQGARGIAIDGAGRVFIADRFRNRILRYDLDGSFVSESPFFFPPSTSFDQMTAVAVSPDDRLYAANEDNHQVVVLDLDYQVLDSFGSQCVAPELPGEGCLDPDGGGPLEVGDGQFNGPAGIAYAPEDRVVVVDTGNDRIQIFDADGGFLDKFGSQGDGEGQFETPVDVAVDASGNIYVADNGNSRIQVFDSDGTFLRAFGSAGSGDGQFSSLTGLAVDHGGNVYATDAGDNHRVQIFDDQGGFVAAFALPDDTAAPRDIALDGTARLHVTTGNASGTPQGVPFVVGVFAIDSDGDGLPDLWETSGIDANLDGEVEYDLSDIGNDYSGTPIAADPNRKDIFVEIDYFSCEAAGGDCDAGDTHEHRPRDDALDLIVQAFDSAPVPPGNGINLWIQLDAALPHQQPCDFQDGCFDAVKAGNFGTQSEQSDDIEVLAAKRLVFRYNLWVHDKEIDNSSSGEAEGDPGVAGNDFIVSLGSWAGAVGNRDDQAGTFMHELGHTLGLGHGGGDNANCKPNYLSVMSYTFQVTGLQPTGQFDYSRTALPTAGALVEDALDETVGIEDGAFTTFYGPSRDFDGLDQGGDGFLDDDWLSAPGAGPIDWDVDGNPGDNPAQPTDVNFLGIRGCGLDQNDQGAPDPAPSDSLSGFVDWDNLQIGLQDSDFLADGQHGDPEPEMDRETAETVREQVWQAQIEELHEYAGKFLCGLQKDPKELRLAPGLYATVVNIHNPNREAVRFRKKLALAFPPAEQRPGRVYPIALDTLGPDEALKVDCEDVRERVFGGSFPAPYIDGFLVVQSPRSLDVVGVYATATLGRKDEPPRHSDLEIVQVPERVLDRRRPRLPDLVIDEAFDLRVDCVGSQTTQRCEFALGFAVRNIGQAVAEPFDVRIVREQDGTPVADLSVESLLAPGTATTLSAEGDVIVVGTDPAARRLCVRADAPTDVVAESREDNNERCLSF